MRKAIFPLLLLIGVCGCAQFDPLGLFSNGTSSVSSVWEKRAPDKDIYKQIYKIWTGSAEKAHDAQYARQYAGLFLALSDRVNKDENNLKRGKDVFDLLDKCREAIGQEAAVNKDFSSAVATLLEGAGIVKPTDQLTPDVRKKVGDTMESVGCGCAEAYDKLRRIKK